MGYLYLLCAILHCGILCRPKRTNRCFNRYTHESITDVAYVADSLLQWSIYGTAYTAAPACIAYRLGLV